MKTIDKIKMEQAFSALKGIDTSLGLELTQHNIILYSKLLLIFQQTQNDFSAQFYQVMQINDFKEMNYLAHALKGAAGSIGANILEDKALILELSCLSKNEPTDNLLSDVIMQLDIVLSGIEQHKRLNAMNYKS